VPIAKVDVRKIWSLNYRLVMSVVTSVAPDITELGLETKELFVLAEVDVHPHPAELAGILSMPKPTVTMYVKRLVAAGFQAAHR
jgi:DNA-binding MarR family transcriptional regulator